MLIVDKITKSIQAKEIVKDCSLSVQAGQIGGLAGPNGAGKTTLLNCISTIDKVTAGRIIVGGRDVTHLKGKELSKFRRQQLGFIFQDFNLLDTLTAYENIALALSIQNIPAQEIEQRVRKVAAQLSIGHVLDKFPYQMSGGEKQRAASARAIITNPSLILADEPTGALDSKSARMLLDSLVRMNDGLGATILMVTHDAFTASYAKRILFIKDGEIFSDLVRGGDSRKEFFERILQVVTLLGGDSDVLY